MYKILVSLLIILLIPIKVCAEQLKFAQITDIHLSLEDSNYRGLNLSESPQILEKAVKSINNKKDIQFVVFSGDNIDSANKDYLQKFCEIIKGLNKPYYVGIGNHDVSKYQGLSKLEYLKTVRKYNKYQFTADTHFYFFPNNEFIIIFMDGVHEIIPSTHGSFTDEDLAWLDNVLTKYSNKKAIIVQHFPLVEPVENVSHRILNPEGYIDLLQRHKNIIALLSGHYHTEKVTLQDAIYHISSPALSISPYLYSVIEINYDKKTLLGESPKLDFKTDLIPIDSK